MQSFLWDWVKFMAKYRVQNKTTQSQRQLIDKLAEWFDGDKGRQGGRESGRREEVRGQQHASSKESFSLSFCFSFYL